MAGTLTTSGLAAGLLAGEEILGPLTMTGVSPIGTMIEVTLASGDNTITLPTGVTVTAVLLVLPTTNAATLNVRTNLDTGTGCTVGLLGYMVFPVPVTASSVIVNASAASGILAAKFI
jgi:hypothetical protein